MFGDSTGASLVEGWAGQKSYSLVPACPLDDVIPASKVPVRTLYLIDIEGAELSCLRGAQNLLDRAIEDVFIIEICLDEHQPLGSDINPTFRETFKLLFDHGFSCWSLSAYPHPVTLKDVDEAVASRLNAFDSHNFVFSKSLIMLKI